VLTTILLRKSSRAKKRTWATHYPIPGLRPRKRNFGAGEV
jgi:hypothetical protein